MVGDLSFCHEDGDPSPTCYETASRTTSTGGDPIADTLVGIQAVLADHERRLFPVNRRGLPEPTGRLEEKRSGMVGDTWEVDADRSHLRGWRVICLDSGEEGDECVYVHTPHSTYDPGVDVVALRPEKARLLAASLLAAADRIESRQGGRMVIPLRTGEVPGV